MIRILLDCYGTDRGISEVVLAGVNAIKKFKDIEITLVGKKEDIENELLNYSFNKKMIKIIDAREEITCNESPVKAIKEKTDSSLVVALNNLKEDYDAVISGGSTGAVLTGGFLKIGRVKGVSRPALCPLLPTMDGKSVMLIDCGSNVDCKPINLCHFAQMANIYMKNVMKVENPKIALLNIGEEEAKGNELSKETYKMLKEMPINFIGNIEARDFLSGKADVVVSDGFSGNVLLKGTEGATLMVLKKLKNEIKNSFFAKIGALFMRKAFKNIRSSLNVNAYGGSVLIGLKKILIKVHGSSTQDAIVVAIEQAIELKQKKVIEQFEEEFSKIAEEGN